MDLVQYKQSTSLRVELQDIDNVIVHSSKLVENNLSLVDPTKLCYFEKISSTCIDDSFKDVDLFRKFNESILYNSVRTRYRQKLNDVVGCSPNNYFIGMRDDSEFLTHHFFNFVRYACKRDDMQNIMASLFTITTIGVDQHIRWDSCKKIYNVLLYAAPCGLVPAVGYFDVLTIYTPYEQIASTLLDMSSSVSTLSLPAYMKIQNYLEGYLIDITYMKHFYSNYKYHMTWVLLAWKRRRQFAALCGMHVLNLSAPALLSVILNGGGYDLRHYSAHMDLPLIVGTSTSRDNARDKIMYEILRNLPF